MNYKPLHPLLKSLADESEQVVGTVVSTLRQPSVVRIEHSRGKNSPASCRRFFAAVWQPCSIATSNILERSPGRLGEQLARRAHSFYRGHPFPASLPGEHRGCSTRKKYPFTMESSFAQLCHLHATLVAEGYIQTEQAKFTCPSRSARRRRRPAARPTIGEIFTACLARAPRCGGFTTGSKPPAGLGARC